MSRVLKTSGQVLAAIIRAANAAENLQAARAAMTWDGGDESLPTWHAYLAALEDYYATGEALNAARESVRDADSTACPDCDGHGIITATRTGTDGAPCDNCTMGPTTW